MQVGWYVKFERDIIPGQIYQSQGLIRLGTSRPVIDGTEWQNAWGNNFPSCGIKFFVRITSDQSTIIWNCQADVIGNWQLIGGNGGPNDDKGDPWEWFPPWEIIPFWHGKGKVLFSVTNY